MVSVAECGLQSELVRQRVTRPRLWCNGTGDRELMTLTSGALIPRLDWGSYVMWPVLWTVVRTYAPYVTFPVAFVVGAVGYHLEWFIRGKGPQPVEEEKSILERREDRKLDELLGKDHTQVVSLKDKLEFAPKAVLNRNRPEKN
ncbi:Small integral membrane protein 12 [Microtus ochrogaster]|uniref:Small integral membrane protein 12 n=1 Tax=Microtus ochrogaster TaxID=79684 RepID=A0A8J6KKX9_MICOH|nr:Small integral membrane protein 12 [Microtus ochrogaster]